jgi:tetratricopeptide (TPR) repeat protein
LIDNSALTIAKMGSGPASSSDSSQPAAPRAEQEFRAGLELYNRGNLSAAIGHLGVAVQVQPGNPTFRRILGLALWQNGDRAAGRLHLEYAVQLAPSDAQAHETLSQLLLEAAEIDLARKHALAAFRLRPDVADCALTLATVLEADRKVDAAWDLVRQVMERGDKSVKLAFVLARIARRVKHESTALQLIDELLASGKLVPRQEVTLRFLAAHLLDGLGRYDEAFNQAQRAHQIAGSLYDAQQHERYVTACINFFTPEKLRSLPRSCSTDSKPVFIVGMPRCGSTLVEQILDSHPAIHGAGELGWISRIAGQAAKAVGQNSVDLPRCLEKLTQANVDELASEYSRPLNALAPTATRIVDKNLANYLHLGFICMLFPMARVIHVRRDPLDTCISCFTNEFVAYDLGADLGAVGHYYRQYERLMEHWRQVSTLPMLEMNYEDVVADLEGASRRMTDFLGLPWDPGCLKFHDNKRFIGTASNRQASQPLYSSSVGRWRHYDKYLAPLRAALAARP